MDPLRQIVDGGGGGPGRCLGGGGGGGFFFWGGGGGGVWKLPVAAGVFVATETGSGLVLALMEHGQKL